MDEQEAGDGGHPLATRALTVSAAFEDDTGIAEARDLARSFLTRVQAVHGLPVSGRAMGMVQLVVSELVTNARKYAPGPCLLTLEIADGAARISVWDSSTTLPAILAPDPSRIGQHGLEIVAAICVSFAIHREPVGKRITADVMLADDPGGAPAGRQKL
ncbi:ATP-binding protein [Streptomyces sp. NEAU-H22]|uniref:ATP-binding protein n=1 Tax=unclassified Streptomyces TaxID=2593676 RepID=UPI00225A3008|nr:MULTISPECIES: ATP-binding protein [unclassified Streptomyces]MCX3291766.1 ATP-binding protein [Streptomyces sp. NEAU-H22]WMD06289.1 ATP-binding protein [Streptomyces sp. FXY-T5]